MSARRVLVFALAVQVLLIAATWWPRDRAASRPKPVFDVERDAITEIEIATRPAEGADEKPVVLARSGDGWVLRSEDDFPADGARVGELLDSLLALHARAPIATQPTSHEALSVAEDDYGRRITVRTADGESSWWMGPAASHAIYMRRVGEDDVYRASGASEWSFRERASGYWDPVYVHEDPKRFDAVAITNAHGSLRFEKRDGTWTLTELADGESADEDAIDELVTGLARVRMDRPVGTELRPEYGLDGKVRVDWTIPAEDQSQSGGYQVGAPADADVYLKAAGRRFVVLVPKSAVRRLQDAQRSDFVKPAGASG